jgi:soluble lytic murein transglycosylase-like protein
MRVTVPLRASTTHAAPAPTATATAVASTSDGLNWTALARCESGGNPRAVSATGKYRGLYQFSTSTWASVGGQGDPIDASAAEQTARAQALYARGGAGQWSCGSHLFD